AAVLAPERAGRRDGGVQLPVGDLDRVAAHASGARLPALPRRMLDEPRDRLEGRAAVVRPEEHARVAAQPELRAEARLEVPGGVQLQPALLRKAELLGSLPRLAVVARAMD